MSVELQYLANRINSTNIQAEFSKDPTVSEEAYNQYCIITRDIGFIRVGALLTLTTYLNENGLKAYKRYYEKWVEHEVAKQKKGKVA